jgi:hypothetical protein
LVQLCRKCLKIDVLDFSSVVSGQNQLFGRPRDGKKFFVIGKKNPA